MRARDQRFTTRKNSRGEPGVVYGLDGNGGLLRRVEVLGGDVKIIREQDAPGFEELVDRPCTGAVECHDAHWTTLEGGRGGRLMNASTRSGGISYPRRVRCKATLKALKRLDRAKTKVDYRVSHAQLRSPQIWNLLKFRPLAALRSPLTALEALDSPRSPHSSQCHGRLVCPTAPPSFCHLHPQTSHSLRSAPKLSSAPERARPWLAW